MKMIKFYVHNHFDCTYTIMVVDHDLPLYAIRVNEYSLPIEISRLREEFSDTGREIRVYEN